MALFVSFPVGYRGQEGAAPAVLKPDDIYRNALIISSSAKLFDPVHRWNTPIYKVLAERKSLQVESQQCWEQAIWLIDHHSSGSLLDIFWKAKCSCFTQILGSFAHTCQGWAGCLHGRLGDHMGTGVMYISLSPSFFSTLPLPTLLLGEKMLSRLKL